jgi:hypothetical protein
MLRRFGKYRGFPSRTYALWILAALLDAYLLARLAF